MTRIVVTVAVTLGALAWLLFVNPFSRDSASADKPPMPDRPRERFAEDREPAETKTVRFDASRAMDYLTELCKIGPRVSGSEGMARQQKLLQAHFEKLGGQVTWQRFDGKQPSQAAAVPMANLLVSWNPEARQRVLFCGHYDTRPIADQEPRRADWTRPFLSANDGTSTVAFLMELAHHVKEIPAKVGIDFALFDGEEFMHDPQRDRFFLGSEHFAAEYKKDRPRHRYTAAVLLDLFAGKDARYKVEQNSHFLAGELCESIWAEAKVQGVEAFVWERGPDVLDDHIALNRAGIPCVDVIDFSYAHWHRLSDLPQNCSARSMENVAVVLIAWVQRLR